MCVCALMLWQAQRLMEHDTGARLLLLTFGMRQVVAGVCPIRISSAAHGGCSGLLYATHKEYPTFLMSTVDVSHEHAMPSLDACAKDISREWAQAWGHALRLAPRLRCDAPLSSRANIDVKDGKFLVTGGLGGLGLRVGSLLQQAGSGLVLTSRSGRVPRDGQGLDKVLTSLLKRRATSLVCDVQERAQVVATLMRESITGIIHAAGVSTNTPLNGVVLSHVEAAYAPKAVGAAHIHAVVSILSLQASLALSSISTFWCRAGQV